MARNYTLEPITAHISGTVTQFNEPRVGILISAFNQEAGTHTSATTDSNGNYSLGVNAGTWTVQVAQHVAAQRSIVSPIHRITLVDGETRGDVNLDLRSSNARIFGFVRNDSNMPVTNGTVFATTTVQGVQYQVGTQIAAGSGLYTLGLFGGTWTVSVFVPGYPQQAPKVTSLSPGTQVQFDITVTHLPFIINPPAPQTALAGTTVMFTVGATSMLPLTHQWQVSLDGLIWNDLADDATYSNTHTPSLSVLASMELDGSHYRCLVSNSAGTVATSGVQLTVINVSVEPGFVQHPTDQYIDEGTLSEFTAVATGSPPPELQWQVSANGEDWTDLPEGDLYTGTQSPTLRIPAAAIGMDGLYYRLAASNVGGTEYSNWGQLRVRVTVQSWLKRVFTPEQLLDPQISGPDATPANDGIPNLVKYAFDLDPFVPDGAGILPVPHIEGDALVLEFTAFRDDVFYRVEASPDLEDWSASEVQYVSEGTYRRAAYSLTGRNRGFLRLVIVIPAAD